jgi:hypothetical protein
MQAFPSSAARIMAKPARRHNRCMAALRKAQGRVFFFLKKKETKKTFPA